MNYEEDVRIDEDALDIEWLEQSSLMMKYIQHNIQMQKILDKTEQDLNVLKAEMDLDIRSHPEKYGIEKVTEGSISATILISKKYKEAYSNFLDIKYEANMAKGAITAFEHKKVSLENLVRLNGQGYFAGPAMPRDISREREEHEKKTHEGTAKSLSRIKRKE
jgi:hypothetical protein